MPNSVSDAVGAAVAAAVQAIGITDSAVAVPVDRRKTPSLPSGKKPPRIVVSVGDVPATEYLTADEKLRTYPVAVTIVTAKGEDLADDPVIRQWRDQIDGAVDTRAAFGSVSGFNQVDAQGGPPFDPAALPKELNYSIQTFAVQVIESRTE